MSLSDKILDLSLRKIVRRGRSALGLGNPWLKASAEVTELLGDQVARHIAALPRRTPGEVEFNGISLAFNDNVALLGMLDEIFVKQNYLFSCTNDRPLIVDCGANIGVGVAYFKSIFPNAIIHAFEPDETAYRCLVENVERNGYRDVFTNQKAVWVRNEELKFFPDGSWGGGLHAKDSAAAVTVQAVDILDLLELRADFLKMDIEGAESDVIQHAFDKISANVDRFFFEWHSFRDASQRLGAILKQFEEAGFRYHIKEASTRMSPFSTTPPGPMDSQLDVFVFRSAPASLG